MTENIAIHLAAGGQRQMLTEMARLRSEATASFAVPQGHELSGISPPSSSFSQVLEQAIHHVDNLQHLASAKQRAVDMGISDDLTGAMLESQKASVAFSAMMQVRNKLSTALDEVMNISI